MSPPPAAATEEDVVGVRLTRRYSRFVGAMKVALPAFAVALIVLFLSWPRISGTGDGYRLSFADLMRDPDGQIGVTRARFAGGDSNNRPFLVTADRAVQVEGFDIFHLDVLQADLTLDSGAWVSVTASTGVFDRANGTLDLEGPIDIFSDRGYELHAIRARVDLDAGLLSSAGAIEGHGPLGTVRADALRYESASNRLTLVGNVRVTLGAGDG